MPLSSPRLSLAFTLVELLVAMSLLFLLLLFTLSMTHQVNRVATSGGPSFQETRTAFETMTRMLSQALLNPYWDYDNPANPVRYIRASELHFTAGHAPALTAMSDTVGNAVFFQAPLGFTQRNDLRKFPRLLNSVGFYVRYSPSPHLPPYLHTPDAVAATAAYRLWMLIEPAEAFSVYDLYNAAPQALADYSWFRTPLANPARNHVLANHVILLLIRSSYLDATGQPTVSYVYDSRPGTVSGAQPVEMHQIPETLQVTLVALDETSADRLLRHSGGRYDLLDSDWFQSATDYSDDLKALQAHLDSHPIGGIAIRYRVFEATVNVNASKWTR